MTADLLVSLTPHQPFFHAPFRSSLPSSPCSPRRLPSFTPAFPSRLQKGATPAGSRKRVSLDLSPLSPGPGSFISKRPRCAAGMTESQGTPLGSMEEIEMEDARTTEGDASPVHIAEGESPNLDLPLHISSPVISTTPHTMPPSPPSSITSSPRRHGSGSPPTLPTPLSMRRANKLALSLSINLPSPPETATSSASTICPSPTNSMSTMSSTTDTPYTPGPPRTPALAMSVGRKGLGRPTLLSLITQPPTNERASSSSQAAFRHPFATLPRSRPRSHTADEEQPFKIPRDPRHSRSALPALSIFKPVEETQDEGLAALGYSLPTSSPSGSSSSRQTSTNSTPSSSPPLPAGGYVDGRVAEPYQDGPVEILPGIYLGAEDSMYHWHTWSRLHSTVRVLNVAQEVDHAFEPDRKGKGRASVGVYQAIEGRTVHYAHLKWSHGEQGLAEVSGARLADILQPEEVEERGSWKFWEAIRWMEQGRRQGQPILIHCQCGVSRSATLSIAYVMALAACGAMPEALGHLKGMQDAYDFVKSKSAWVGPNVSLVFQLVEFARNLTDLLTAHLPLDPPLPERTSWPTAQQAAITEDEWARQRREFEEAAEGAALVEEEGRRVETPTLLSPEEVRDEAEMLDKAMIDRRRDRISPLRVAV